MTPEQLSNAAAVASRLAIIDAYSLDRIANGLEKLTAFSSAQEIRALSADIPAAYIYLKSLVAEVQRLTGELNRVEEYRKAIKDLVAEINEESKDVGVERSSGCVQKDS